MNDDILGRKGRKGCFYLWPSLACDNFATWEYLHKWASRARHVQSYTMGLNTLLPEQTARAQGIPLLNMPFSLAVHVINECTGLAFWQWCRNTCKWGGVLGAVWGPWETRALSWERLLEERSRLRSTGNDESSPKSLVVRWRLVLKDLC